MIKNPLLLVTIAALAAYWSIGWYIPGVILSSSMAMFSILIGAAIIVRYSSGFWHVLVEGGRSDREDGAHLAALGIPSIAASIVWGGVWTLCWNMSGQPDSWLGTPTSNFSRALLIAGCIALYLTPDVQRERLSLPGVMWLTAIMVTAVFTAFLLGAYLGNEPVKAAIQSQRVSHPVCPEDRPYWSATHSNVYHGPDSPHRVLVKPRRCFATAREAEAQGYQPPNVLTSPRW